MRPAPFTSSFSRVLRLRRVRRSLKSNKGRQYEYDKTKYSTYLYYDVFDTRRRIGVFPRAPCGVRARHVRRARIVPHDEYREDQKFGGIKNIDVGTFIENIWENTGIYQMIHTKTVAERAAEKAAAAASAAQQANDPFAGVTVPAWYSLIMIAIGFLIIYLGAAWGFEPLL